MEPHSACGVPPSTQSSSLERVPQPAGRGKSAALFLPFGEEARVQFILLGGQDNKQSEARFSEPCGCLRLNSHLTAYCGGVAGDTELFGVTSCSANCMKAHLLLDREALISHPPVWGGGGKAGGATSRSAQWSEDGIEATRPGPRSRLFADGFPVPSSWVVSSQTPGLAVWSTLATGP